MSLFFAKVSQPTSSMTLKVLFFSGCQEQAADKASPDFALPCFKV